MYRVLLMSVALIAMYGHSYAAIVHTDINDTQLTAGGSIEIDFNGDGTAEFTIEDMGMDNIEPGLMFGADNALATVSPDEWDVLKGLSANTSVDANTGWHAYGDAYIDPFWGTTLFPTNADTYLGAKFKLGNNVHFGWICVQWDGNGAFTVKEYAYQDSPNTAILAGDKGSTGIAPLAEAELKVFPNPAKDWVNIKIKGDKTDEIKLYDLSGKLLIQFKEAASETNIRIDQLKAGIYMLHIHTLDGTTTVQKFNKQ